jgi:hypothetical protein
MRSETFPNVGQRTGWNDQGSPLPVALYASIASGQSLSAMQTERAYCPQTHQRTTDFSTEFPCNRAQTEPPHTPIRRLPLAGHLDSIGDTDTQSRPRLIGEHSTGFQLTLALDDARAHGPNVR